VDFVSPKALVRDQPPSQDPALILKSGNYMVSNT